MTAEQPIADLFRPDRQRRHWPSSSHCRRQHWDFCPSFNGTTERSTHGYTGIMESRRPVL